MWVTVTLLSLVADLSYLVVFSSYDACALVWRFLGTYSGEEVAVKVLNPENLNQNAWSEFKQEIYMLRYSTLLWIIVYHCFFITWGYHCCCTLEVVHLIILCSEIDL
jgi:hypothetical protein